MRLKDGQELKADLVIDASGRRSKLPEWLEAAGYDAPEEAHVDSGIGYSMRLYEMPEKARHCTPCLMHLSSLYCCSTHAGHEGGKKASLSVS